MILVIGGIKGGGGKTTLATNLAQLRAYNGYKVLLVDADDQGSAYDWYLQRSSSGLDFASLTGGTRPFVTIQMTGKSVYSNLIKMQGDYDDIIVDTGGRDTVSQRAAMSAANKFLIPFRPRSIDIWTIGHVKRLISECQNTNMKSYAVINQADPKGSDNEDAYDIISKCETIQCLPLFIGYRKAFGNAATEGRSVFEMNPKDEKACKEIKDLYDRIYA